MSRLTPHAAQPAALLQRLSTNLYCHLLLLTLYCGVLFFYGINTGPFYRTESLRAIVAREFLRTGNWIVPTLYGEPLLTKPPIHYAAIALVSWPGGAVTEWSARLPSALAACVTVVLFYSWFGRALGRRAGLVAALIVPASFMWLDRVPSAEIDMVQLAWVVASLYCFFRALEKAEQGEMSGRTAGAWWVAALLCVAAGVLTKWTAPLFFYGTVIPLLWWRGRLRLLWSMPHLLAAVVGSAVVLMWLSAVVRCVGWQPLLDTLGQEALPKFLPGQRDRGYPWQEVLLLPARLFVSNLPWSAFALVTLLPRTSQNWSENAKRLLQLFHCWLWPNLLFWSVVPNHAPRHSFPLAPAFAGLAALVWIMHFPERSQRLTRWSLALIVVTIVVVKIGFVSYIVPDRTRLRQPREKGELLGQRMPPDTTLYLFNVKDEGIMFYYGRPVRRLPDPSSLPRRDDPCYCILTEAEWWRWRDVTTGETLQELTDEQGAVLLLVRMRFVAPPAQLAGVNPPAKAVNHRDTEDTEKGNRQ